MLFNFLGSPQSGKTTTAAMVFASLKEVGMITEFVPEQARFYIAKYRVKNKLEPYSKIELSDEDQYSIMKNQIEVDETFYQACGSRIIVITDSSPLNSLLYMSKDFQESSEIKNLIIRSLSITQHSFYSKPIPRPNNLGGDPNRVHSFEQSLQIDRTIPEMISKLNLKSSELCGTMDERLHLVLETIFNNIK